MITHSVSLDEVNANRLEALAARYPGATVHALHLTVVRLGLEIAELDNHRVAAELIKIHEERRERRRVRLEKDANTETGGENGSSK